MTENKKYNCLDCVKELISNGDNDFFGVDLEGKNVLICSTCYYKRLKKDDLAIAEDYYKWHNFDKKTIPIPRDTASIM